MMTLLLFAHPDFQASRANRAMLDAVADVSDLEVRRLYDLYPDGRIDAATERSRLLRADRLVFQFPLQWYATPALLKEWQDAVLSPLVYGDPAATALMAGLPVIVATTTGGPFASYRPGGSAATIDALLAPLETTARRCGWQWRPPFAVHDVRNLDDADLARAAADYRAALLSVPMLDRKHLTES
ncbi:NAD(P)H-dependent oxidoreductase [Salinicola sp. CPA57]|uniref:NAD(P)H-dependent oxidoreductase n=1 Tax=Salinicola sp. CPA57 TaxID=1949080 RepID=UPI001300713A|nr:NAD(P)H-dependent oxidoreductase [Salinicola sp. CPA57]